QLAPSFCRFTHAPLHDVSPFRQLSAQRSPLHVALPSPFVGGGQFVPHLVPQLLVSVLETQEPPQRCRPWLHWMPQVVPPAHVALPAGSVGHTWVHEPQCCGSVCSLTHAPLQSESPTAHPEAHAKAVPASLLLEQSGVPPLQVVEQSPHRSGVLIVVQPS